VLGKIGEKERERACRRPRIPRVTSKSWAYRSLHGEPEERRTEGGQSLRKIKPAVAGKKKKGRNSLNATSKAVTRTATEKRADAEEKCALALGKGRRGGEEGQYESYVPDGRAATEYACKALKNSGGTSLLRRELPGENTKNLPRPEPEFSDHLNQRLQRSGEESPMLTVEHDSLKINERLEHSSEAVRENQRTRGVERSQKQECTKIRGRGVSFPKPG